MLYIGLPEQQVPSFKQDLQSTRTRQRLSYYIRQVVYIHWRGLVKNIGWENQNIWEKNVVKSDKCMNVSQLLGGRVPGQPPKVYAYVYISAAHPKVVSKTFYDFIGIPALYKMPFSILYHQMAQVGL